MLRQQHRQNIHHKACKLCIKLVIAVLVGWLFVPVIALGNVITYGCTMHSALFGSALYLLTNAVVLCSVIGFDKARAMRSNKIVAEQANTAEPVEKQFEFSA